MRVFVIFGTIEFLDDDEHTALVHSVDHATHMFEGQIENYARSIDKDYLMPHYYNGRITFVQFHKESDH
jgi:hypothetical protein